MFLVLREKDFSTENFGIPLLCLNSFDTRNSWNTKGFHAKSFGTLRQKKSTKSWYSSYTKHFWWRNVSETLKGSPTNNFGTARQKILNRKSWFTLIMLKSFRYPEWVEQWKVLPRKVSELWDKKHSTQNRDTPNIQKILMTEHSWNT